MHAVQLMSARVRFQSFSDSASLVSERLKSYPRVSEISLSCNHTSIFIVNNIILQLPCMNLWITTSLRTHWFRLLTSLTIILSPLVRKLCRAFLLNRCGSQDKVEELGLWCLTPLSTTFQLYRGG
jgi:hypothetical protein